MRRTAYLGFMTAAVLSAAACRSGSTGGGGFTPPASRPANIVLTAVAIGYPYTAVGYSSPFPSSAAALRTPSSGIQTTWMAHDASGDLFVAENPVNPNPSVTSTATPEIAIYTPPYAKIKTTITNGIDSPVWMAIDNLGNLFVANVPQGASYGTMNVYAPPYTSAPFTTIANVSYSSAFLALGPNGVLFSANQIGPPCFCLAYDIYTPPYTAAPQSISLLGFTGDSPFAFDAYGNLFVGNFQEIDEYSPPAYNPVTPITGLNLVDGVIIGKSGELFAMQYSSFSLRVPNTVEAYSPPYTGAPTTITPCPSGYGIDDKGAGMTSDDSGNLFVVCWDGTITVWAPPYTEATPTYVLAGNVWGPIMSLQSTPASFSSARTRAARSAFHH